MIFAKPLTLAAALWCCLLLPILQPTSARGQPSNGVLREVYLNIGGNSVADLTSHPSFPDGASFETIEPTFESPNGIAEEYGQRLRALLVAPTNGNYTFWIASDDGSVLYLSSDEQPAQKLPVANVGGWTASREWTKEANQRSAPITLVGGRRYYIEALQKEGAGGDHVTVRWQLPDGTIEEPIPNHRLLVYGLGPPVITRQPTNLTVVEGSSATFAIQLQRAFGATFQWQRNGTNLVAATNSSYSLAATSLGDNNSRFRCLVTNSLGNLVSAEAVLTVQADTTPPSIGTVGNLGDSYAFFVVFSENVEVASATNAAFYTLDGGVNVVRATMGSDGRTVLLATDVALIPNVVYRLTVNQVRDRAATPNTIVANSQRTFSVTTRPLDISLLTPSREPLGPSSRRHGVVISEVMYHPPDRSDGRVTEFVEIYNSQPWFEEIGGWRITGAINYQFPSNTVLAARSYLVVAAAPADLEAVYGPRAMLGPYQGHLENGGGTLRLRNRSDAILFEFDYSDEAPFPAAADGAGHSLVLARPSYGERDPQAWAASDSVGGSPGLAEPVTANALRTVMLNEFLAHTDLPQFDFVELFNYGLSSVNVGGCILTDETGTNKFVIPANTTLAGRSYLTYYETNLGFALSAAGERILLINPGGTKVLDAVRFGAQENGRSTGRFPDGSPVWSRLAHPSPQGANAPLARSEVVINEILFDPLSADADDEFVELYNRGSNAVNLSGWRLRGGISYNIPNGTLLGASNYLVIARSASRLRTNYAGLTVANTLGDFEGRLAAPERIELNRPDQVTITNAQGQAVVDTIRIVVDEVTFGEGGRWGRWAAGGGSSLELIDPQADSRRAPNWADSDETFKSSWVTVETTGVLDHGWSEAYQLHVTLLGAGEVLIDNVEVIPAGGANLLTNSNFELGVEGWVFQGNHKASSWDTREGYNSRSSLHLRASGRGDSGSNRIRTQLPSTLAAGTTVTLRAKVRWLKGNPNVLLRLRGNWLEAPGFVAVARHFGTPGTRNSRAAANVGPAITEVRHHPPLPAAGTPALVTAQVHDPNGLAYLVVHYRQNSNATYMALAMTNNGAGLFSTLLPAQASGSLLAFYIQAADNAAPPQFTTFPADAPDRECLVRWGDTQTLGSLPTYRFWISQTNVSRWSSEEKMSNHPKDVTFVYGTNRVIYNAGGLFHGSPFHSPSYNSPVGNPCDYDLIFPADDLLLGETDINLFRPGNGGGDATAQREIQGYWFGDQFDLPFLYHRPVFVIVNGLRRETVFHDAQQPNGDFVRQWFPDDADGELHKIQLGFEFGDQGYGAGETGFSAVGANLARYHTTGGVKKLARYRATWPLRSVAPSLQNNYSNLYALVEAANVNAALGSDAYTTTLSSYTDVEQWFKVHVTQHLYNNPDSFSYGGGQNAFTYKPERDTWKLLLWDVDFAFGGSPTDANLTGIGGADHGPRNDHPPFARLYWQALLQAAQGMLSPERSNPILRARQAGMTAAGAAVGSSQSIEDFIAARRLYILSRIQELQSPFAVTTPGQITTNRNLIVMGGTAPLELRTLEVNGVAYPMTWTTLSNWTVRIPLQPGTNALSLAGFDRAGKAVAGATGLVQVNFTGADEVPEEKVIFHEIMYHPLVEEGEYIELYNRSLSNAFDLSHWRLEGADFEFPEGVVIEPGQYLILARNRVVFAATYGANLPVAAEFSGRLSGQGETLSLLRPATVGGPAVIVVDQITYATDQPWPAAADGTGSSLQLRDARQDNNRAANWSAVSSLSSNVPQTLVVMTNLWRFEQNSDLSAVNWAAPGYNDNAWPAGRGLLYVESAALPGPKTTPLVIGRNTYYFRTHFNFNGSTAGAALKLSAILDDGAVIYLNGQELHRIRMPAGTINYATSASAGVGDAILEGPIVLPATALVSGDNVLAVEVHQSGTGSTDIVLGLSLETTYEILVRTTPGQANSVAETVPAFPTLWLNEVLPNNLFLGTNGVADRFGERDPWVELYNGGTNLVSLSGLYLASNYSNLLQWPFPAGATIAPGAFLVVWLDGQPHQSSSNELHTSFRAPVDVGSIVLSRGPERTAIVDHLNYRIPVAGRSYGSHPDGNASHRRQFSVVTPAAANNPAQLPVDVRINEWMADNGATLVNPHGGFDDWIELYNATDQPVDLEGFQLTDSLANPSEWTFPPGTLIGPRGFLLVWADNGALWPGEDDLQADFSLSRDGEAIGLFAPDGRLVDAIVYTAQTTDVSQGRFPDGEAALLFMTNATPRAPNFVATTNSVPSLNPLPDRSLEEGATIAFTVVATDPDLPRQRLTFSLQPGAPAGASIHADTGVFRWTPGEADGPGHYRVAVLVTDDGLPVLGSERVFYIEVREVNNAPMLLPVNSRTLREGTTLLITNSVTDPDGDTEFTFALAPNAPSGLTIHPANGLITWTPGEADGPGNHPVTFYVIDHGDPPRAATNQFSVLVQEENTPPQLSFAEEQTVTAHSTLAFFALATDIDLPEQVMSFSLLPGAPSGALIDAATGWFTWTPSPAEIGTNQLTIRVSDDSSPPAATTKLLRVVVRAGFRASIARGEGSVTIRFPAVPGRRYQVEFRADLTMGNWNPLGAEITAETPSVSVSDSVSAQRFYRVVQLE